MAFLGSLSLRKKLTLTNLGPLVEPLTGKSLKDKIRMNLTLVSNVTLTAEERLRIPTDVKDIISLTDLQKAWCWINCSMRLSSAETLEFMGLIKEFKQTFESINSMLENEHSTDDVLKSEFNKFINLRIQLNALKVTLQEKYKPGATREINAPREGKESGAPLWAEPLAKIYHNIGGPDNVSANAFIQYLQDRRENLNSGQQHTVHSTLVEFGPTKELAAPALKNYISKTRAALPPSFARIFAKGGRRNRTQRRRKTRKNKKY